MKAYDLDGHTELFGWKFDYTPGKSSNGLVSLYTEDDEWYGEPKMSFDIAWLSDLEEAIKRIKKEIEHKKAIT